MKKGEQVTGEIVAMAFGGKGILKVEDKVVFVEKTILGQIVTAQITKNKNSYAEAKLISIDKKSPIEQETDFQPTPGAPWLAIPVEKQQQIKREIVFEHFKKFAKIDLSIFFDELIASPQTWYYRNKMEYSFGPTDETCTEDEEENRTWEHHGFGLGSKKRGQFWLVESLEKPSGLFDTQVEKPLAELRKWCEKTGLNVYNTRSHKGFFRHLMVRKSFYEDTFLVHLITSSQDVQKFKAEDFKEQVVKLIPNAKGVLWSINDSLGDTIQNLEKTQVLHGSMTITDVLLGLSFEVSTHSFFQPNPAAAEEIYKKVIEYLAKDSAGHIYDLYCGTGTIGQIIAKHFPEKSITGVEIVPDAVANAEYNAEKNGVMNVKFVCNKVENFLKDEGEQVGESTVILDPPRAGLHPDALKHLTEYKPKNIVYVSCNPATMARDISAFKEAGYQLENFSLVDQFPHTPHVESIAKLILKG